MEKRKLLVAMAIVIMAVGLQGYGFARESGEVLELVNNHGVINWSRGIVYAKGIGKATEKTSQKGEEGSAEAKAEMDARSHLFETINRVRIDSSTLVEDLVKKNDLIRMQLKDMIKVAEIVKREYLSDGTVELTLGLKLHGGFAQFILPREIKHVPNIKTISPRVQKRKNIEEDTKPGVKIPVAGVYTGLILDARGLKGRPAMCVMIVDEDGREVYGSAYVSREFAVHHGMARYEKEIKAARNSQRVSDNPLIIRGLRAQGSGRCDFVISNADASKIRGASENLLFLKKCRVIIVLD